ncbi:MAG: aspartate aminotransferase family protein [Fervidobacterium sp.]|jgi:acetylornithine/succinyldiaminopimelate/putrescine aminotransferase
MNYIADTYYRYPIEVSHAKGMYIWDIDGKEYIDTFMGIGVLLFGHNYEKVIEAMKRKMDRYVHLSNFFFDEDAEAIAERLVKESSKGSCKDGKVFFTNSGTESTECALKVIRKFKKSGKIVSFLRNFHGRTLKALSITGFDSIREQFISEPDVVFLPYNIDTVREFFESEKDIAAVFVEVVHGSGGLDVIDTEIVKLIKEYKAQRNFILVADEVQSGLGRTGKFYAYQHFDMEPDIITLAKGLGGGLPLGACVLLGEYKDAFTKGEHGSTFAPNPVALAGGRAVLELINDNTLSHVEKMGAIFEEDFNLNFVESIKGMGLMRGLVIKPEVKDIIKITPELFLQHGLLVNVLGNGVIRLLLPLNITEHESNIVAERFKKVLEKF